MFELTVVKTRVHVYIKKNHHTSICTN